VLFLSGDTIILVPVVPVLGIQVFPQQYFVDANHEWSDPFGSFGDNVIVLHVFVQTLSYA
jgi:cell division ATPase FtsA